VDFLLAALDLLARRGAEFLRVYAFDRASGEWRHVDESDEASDLEALTQAPEAAAVSDSWAEERSRCLAEAETEADRLAARGPAVYARDPEEIESLKFFRYILAR